MYKRHSSPLSLIPLILSEVVLERKSLLHILEVDSLGWVLLGHLEQGVLVDWVELLVPHAVVYTFKCCLLIIVEGISVDQLVPDDCHIVDA